MERIEHQVAALLADQVEFPVVAADGNGVAEIGFKLSLWSGQDGALDLNGFERT